MPQSLANISTKEYPGRMIIIGQAPSGINTVIIYAVTGRSPSSQARRMIERKDGIWVRPTDEDILKKGNPELLVYPAILFGRGIAVSNGKQTTDIRASLSGFYNAIDVLKASLRDWNYEPDPPAFTPRISGCVLSRKKAAMSIIRKGKFGSSSRHYFEIPIIPGKGKLISTYEGKNVDPLPSFAGLPEDVFLARNTAQETACDVYDALRPKEQKKDFRVSVACVFSRTEDLAPCETAIINRQERNENAQDC